jgi:DNA-binding transcriptional regulator YiaG
VRNPCVEKNCDLLHESKNNERCENCPDRLAYVAAMGNMTHSLPLAMTNLAGNSHGGGASMEVNDMPENSIEDAKNPDDMVNAFCRKYGIEKEKLLEKTKKRDARVEALRRELIVELKNRFSLNQSEVARIVNRSSQRVAQVLARAAALAGRNATVPSMAVPDGDHAGTGDAAVGDRQVASVDPAAIRAIKIRLIVELPAALEKLLQSISRAVAP